MLSSTTARRLLPAVFICLALSGITCAPRDENHVDIPPPSDGDGSIVNGQPPEAPVELPREYKDRIDAARESIRRRNPLTNHGFWTVFHYILGVGPDRAFLRDANDTRKLVNAIEFISAGNRMPGLVFEEKPDGMVDVATLAGTGIGQGHQDQFVAEMTQWGMSKDHVFMVNGNKHTFGDFVRHSKMRASLKKQQELSWAVLIIGEYYGTDHKWTNNLKEELSLADVVRYEISEPINATTTCGGTHRLFDLTWVYHRHRQRGGKKEGVWADTVKYLEKYKTQAREFQNKDSTFSTKYVLEPSSEGDTELRINTTGHVLEWLSLYLADAELREPWVRDAADALAQLLLRNAHLTFDGGSYYHASHALEIYRTRVFGADNDHPPVIPPIPKD